MLEDGGGRRRGEGGEGDDMDSRVDEEGVGDGDLISMSQARLGTLGRREAR